MPVMKPEDLPKGTAQQQPQQGTTETCAAVAIERCCLAKLAADRRLRCKGRARFLPCGTDLPVLLALLWHPLLLPHNNPCNAIHLCMQEFGKRSRCRALACSSFGTEISCTPLRTGKAACIKLKLRTKARQQRSGHYLEAQALPLQVSSRRRLQ